MDARIPQGACRGRKMAPRRPATGLRKTTLALLIGGLVLGQGALSPAALAATDASAQGTSQPAPGQDSPWPLTIKSGVTTLSLYQPQLDSWDGFTLKARMAVQAATGTDSPHTSFGILNVEARTLTDKGKRLVSIDHLKIDKSEFPSAEPKDAKAWVDAITRDFAGKTRTVALDRLEAQLQVGDTAKPAERHPLQNQPPQILFSAVPAILISIDREPVLKPEPGTSLQRIINTRPLVLRDGKGQYFLRIFDGWMSAPALDAPWAVVTKADPQLDKAYKRTLDAHLIDPLSGQSTTDKPAPSLKQIVPAIHVATQPTELIVTDGAPKWTPIEGTQLLFVENTTAHVFKEIQENKTYVLITGRWFRASSETGPWEYVAANQLPPDFARIPDASPKENVKASVAGTPQAREAAIAASVPQTAAVKISGTKMEAPKFDGSPSFRPIEGTPLQYAANTSTPVIEVDAKSFYALQNGVWFVATSVSGPWKVAVSVPAVIYGIPPSSSLYFVTYVRIYSVSGDVVYVGYTPGYQGTYIDPVTGVVVYGTGYVYDPWVGTVWYGTSVTYGYGASVAYTPWTGWAVGFCFGWAWGAATVAMGWGWGPYPYWGPWAYPAWGAAWGPHGGYAAWGPRGWAGYTGNIYSQWGNRATVSRAAGGYDAWTGNAWATQVGKSYNSRTGISSAGQRGAVQNVYTGNFAAGSRGIATGPGGNVVVGERGVAGNAYTGQGAAGNRGAFYNKETGQWTTFGGATGSGGGHVAHVGDDVYAGKDGNVYRHTDNGWEQHSSGGGWQQVPGSAQGEATRQAGGGLGATQGSGGEHTLGGAERNAGGGERNLGVGEHNLGGAEHNLGTTQHLDAEREARNFGENRTGSLRESSVGLDHGFRGGRMRAGGFHGFRR